MQKNEVTPSAAQAPGSRADRHGPARSPRRMILAACLCAAALAGHSAHAGSVSYSYDALGRLARAVYSSGSATTTITYSYDAAGNRSSVVTTTP